MNELNVSITFVLCCEFNLANTPDPDGTPAVLVWNMLRALQRDKALVF
jgi:hypothetical protein